MDIKVIIAGLDNNAGVFKETLSGIPAELITWKRQPSDWNLLGIVCHLVDEEKLDFRARVKHALETPNIPLVPFDPIALIEKHNYEHQEYLQMVDAFLEEREKSIEWLSKLGDVPWSNTIDHPFLGKISAASFLANWLAHDYHHIRQINVIKHAYLKQLSGDELTYAGKW
ncbi:DinB family protein [Muricauda sp. 2012CJ35-5]|uniref:DinB family protein n=1 Tax=Flagellimonas spongiicola TaxID=2942208 RepID=A0ABT0PV72_9FLAO|nr:DinB family protein [Allomuricauda spongiicola]MCL6275262.1 DinB family protein [Allomuricauda spongiicola]